MRYSFFHMDFDTALKVQLIFHCESVQKRSMILNHNIFNYITEKGFYVAKVFLFLLVFIIQWTWVFTLFIISNKLWERLFFVIEKICLKNCFFAQRCWKWNGAFAKFYEFAASMKRLVFMVHWNFLRKVAGTTSTVS